MAKRPRPVNNQKKRTRSRGGNPGIAAGIAVRKSMKAMEEIGNLKPGQQLILPNGTIVRRTADGVNYEVKNPDTGDSIITRDAAAAEDEAQGFDEMAGAEAQRRQDDAAQRQLGPDTPSSAGILGKDMSPKQYREQGFLQSGGPGDGISEPDWKAKRVAAGGDDNQTLSTSQGVGIDPLNGITQEQSDEMGTAEVGQATDDELKARVKYYDDEEAAYELEQRGASGRTSRTKLSKKEQTKVNADILTAYESAIKQGYSQEEAQHEADQTWHNHPLIRSLGEDVYNQEHDTSDVTSRSMVREAPKSGGPDQNLGKVGDKASKSGKTVWAEDIRGHAFKQLKSAQYTPDELKNFVEEEDQVLPGQGGFDKKIGREDPTDDDFSDAAGIDFDALTPDDLATAAAVLSARKQYLKNAKASGSDTSEADKQVKELEAKTQAAISQAAVDTDPWSTPEAKRDLKISRALSRRVDEMPVNTPAELAAKNKLYKQKRNFDRGGKAPNQGRMHSPGTKAGKQRFKAEQGKGSDTYRQDQFQRIFGTKTPSKKQLDQAGLRSILGPQGQGNEKLKNLPTHGFLGKGSKQRQKRVGIQGQKGVTNLKKGTKLTQKAKAGSPKANTILSPNKKTKVGLGSTVSAPAGPKFASGGFWKKQPRDPKTGRWINML